MKIKIDKHTLTESLNHTIKGISNKNLIPILNCIKIDVVKEGMYLTSTNNEISIKTFISKNKIDTIEELGTIVVYGRLFYEYVRKLPNELITLEELIDNKLKIYTKSSSSDINCNDKNDFPKLNFETKKRPLVINGDLLKTIINKTIYAASTNEERVNLTGISIKINDKTMKCEATDSYRIATKRIELNEKVDENINIIVPSKNLLELSKILENSVIDIEIHVFNNSILFKMEELLFVSRLINATFPEVENIIPPKFEIKLKVKLNDFYDAIDRTSLLSKEESKQTVNLKLENNKLILKAIIPEIGKVEEEIEVNNEENKQIDISFSAKYMMDAIRNLKGEEIVLAFVNNMAPITILSEEEEDYIQLFQAIRTY